MNFILRDAARAVVVIIVTATLAFAQDDRNATYHDHASLESWSRSLADAHPTACVQLPIGASREGRGIAGLRLAMPGDDPPDDRPAVLLVANIDGDHLAGSTVALAVAEELLTRAAAGDADVTAALMRHTIYVVPRVNPDAAERFFDDTRTGHRRNMRPDDADRDGQIDEDPPDDLDGDGLVTWMRVADPREDDRRADANEPRLDTAADRAKGERPEFRIIREGRDNDGDGAINEDDLGGVDLNRNYMHGYVEHADGAGPHPVSEPETRALIEFVLDHQNIAAVLAYGVHDNLAKSPDGKGTLPSGAPKGILEDDVALYERIGESFREITGLEKIDAETSRGAFHAWAYAQFGVPAFATPLWTHPQPEKDEDDGDEPADDGDEAGGEAAGEANPDGLTPSGIGDIAMETLDALRAAAEARGFEVTEEMVADLTPERVEQFAKSMGIPVQRLGNGRKDGSGGKADAGEIGWLTYSDSRDGAGFVAWHAFDHPDLGPVEIGGWAPYFKLNPPAEELPALAEKQTAFVLDLSGRLPRVVLEDAEVTRLAAGLYEVRTALINEGELPTGTAMAVKNRRARPHVVRLELPLEQVVAGNRVHKVWSIPGTAGREELRWILEAEDDADLRVTVYSEKYGGFETTIPLTDNQEDAR